MDHPLFPSSVVFGSSSTSNRMFQRKLYKKIQNIQKTFRNPLKISQRLSEFLTNFQCSFCNGASRARQVRSIFCTFPRSFEVESRPDGGKKSLLKLTESHIAAISSLLRHSDPSVYTGFEDFRKFLSKSGAHENDRVHRGNSRRCACGLTPPYYGSRGCLRFDHSRSPRSARRRNRQENTGRWSTTRQMLLGCVVLLVSWLARISVASAIYADADRCTGTAPTGRRELFVLES
jgi:hypothetical protein